MICIFSCDEEEKAAFQRAARQRGLDVFITDRALDAAAPLPDGAVVSVSHKEKIDAAVIDLLRRRGVRYLSTRSVGTNHIDVQYAAECGITVEGVCYSPESIAEHALLLMLMAVRQVEPVLERARRGDFRLGECRCGSLFGKTVGIIGTGKIGSCMAGLLKGFGCRILAYSNVAAEGFTYTDLPTLLRESDIVTLHLPLTEETHHLLCPQTIGMMKPGAILVNTARGALVDSAALEAALRSGHIGAAALDVAEGEEGCFYHDCGSAEGLPFSGLLTLPNVILTPHCAFYTRQALSDIVENTLTNCMKHERSNHESA